jgi:hypothetical protein
MVPPIENRNRIIVNKRLCENNFAGLRTIRENHKLVEKIPQ